MAPSNPVFAMNSGVLVERYVAELGPSNFVLIRGLGVKMNGGDITNGDEEWLSPPS